MKFKRFLKAVVFLQMLSFCVTAQNTKSYIPLNIQKAIGNHTRTTIGIPGKNYWQNHSNYKITVDFSPEKNTLSGKVEIVYFNESPDTLSSLVMNLYQNIFQKGNSRDWNIGNFDLHDGVQIRSLKIDGQKLDNKKYVSRDTKLIVTLAKKLLPKDSLRVDVEWSEKFPSEVPIRMGKYSDSSYLIGYWYPQMAVYDDIDGWDMISYHGSVEFYNDFSNYDVSVKVPEGWMVWATGVWQNNEDILHPQVNDKYLKAQKSDEIISIISQKDYNANKVFAKSGGKTFRYKASSVPDFAFAVAKGFNWDGTSLLVDHNKQVFVDAVYPEHAVSGKHIAGYARQSIDYMSKHEPGLPYPYPKMTTYLNGRRNGGMEFPMLANNGDPAVMDSDSSGLAEAMEVTFHEIAHSYMPFFMGTNEKKYAWMDEGWARLWPHQLVDSIFENADYMEYVVKSYETKAGVEYDVPPIVPNYLLAANYQSLRLASYERSAMAYHFMKDAVGENVFKKALNHYMRIWAGKHPIPIDFFSCIQFIISENLNWFIEPWFYNHAYPDLAIKDVIDNKKIVVENVGGLPLPIHLKIVFDDNTTEIIEKNSTAWKNNAVTFVISPVTSKPIKEVFLGSDVIPDSNKENNHLLIN